MTENERIIEDIPLFGGQDSDTALEYIGDGNFIDALNIVNNSSGVGNKGIVTNLKGNLEVEFDLPDGENLTIGTAEDHENRKFYFFNWNSNKNHGIYQFNSITRTVQKVLLNIIDTGGVDILKFDKNYLILHADVLRGNQLFWVDGLNEARKTNIDKLLDKTDTGYGEIILEEYISAYKSTANYAPKVKYFSDATKPYNKVYGILRRFATRFVYDDGEKSNWSDYSAIALPDKEPYSGINFIPTENNGLNITFETGNRLVTRIEIGMQTTSGEKNDEGILNWQLVTTIDKDKFGINDNSEFTYSFYNDGTYPVTAYEKIIRPHIYLPKQPKTQSYAKGKIIYGGGKEGFENVNIDVDVNVTYEDLFISDGGSQEYNTPSLLSSVIDDSADYLYPGDGYTKFDGSFGAAVLTPMRAVGWEIKVGSDIKLGNVFTVTLKNTKKTYSYSYTSKITDSSATVANALKSLIITSGVIAKKTPDNPTYDIYESVTDGFGVTSFKFIAIDDATKGYFDCQTSAEKVLYSKLEDNGESKTTQKLGSTVKYAIQYENDKKSLAYTDDKLVVPLKTINELIKVDGKTGPQAAITNLSIKHKPPTWAKFYQIVRSSDLIYQDYIQLLIQKAITLNGTTNDEYLDLVVGSLFTYNKIHPNSNLSYSFTKGDRLRLIKKTTSGEYYDFFETEILNYFPVVTEQVKSNLVTDGSAIITVNSASDDNIGRFIIIDGSEREIIGVSSPTKYTLNAPIGESTSKTFLHYELKDYRGVIRIRKSSITIEDLSLVEVFNPSQGNITVTQYFEFQKKFPILNSGTDNPFHAGNVQSQDDFNPAIVKITEGTAYVRSRQLPITNSFPDAQVAVETIEDPSFSDFYPSLINDNGRTTVEDIGVGEIEFKERLRFSNNSIENTKLNGLLDFDALDYKDLNDEYGAIKRTVSSGNNIFIFKELTNGYVPLNSKITIDNAGTSLRVGSANFLNDMEYFARDGGIGDNPEAYCSNSNHKYIANLNEGVIIRIGLNGEEPISKTFKLDKQVKELFNNAAKHKAKVFLSFNSKLSLLIVAVNGYEINNQKIEGVTLVFNEDLNLWGGYHSYNPEYMHKFIDGLFVFKDGKLWEQDVNETRNNFFGVQYPSRITLVANAKDKSGKLLNKLYYQLKIDSNDKWSVPSMITPKNETYPNGMKSMLHQNNFTLDRGNYWADIMRDMLDPQYNNEVEALFSGRVMEGNMLIFELENNSTKEVRLTGVHVYSSPQDRNV